MKDSRATLGYSIFSGLENNVYLNKIYSDLLYNYAIKTFQLTNMSYRQVDIDDALQFADILSKSIGTGKVELHQALAQEIVILLDTLFPNNDEIKYTLGSVLTASSNFLGLKHGAPDYIETSFWDMLNSQLVKSYLQIPSADDEYFLPSQKDVFDGIETEQFFSYSGPTSMGKSFVMRTFIKERIKKQPDCNFAIVVPTKALINEVSKEMSDNLNTFLREYDYRIVTSAGATVLHDGNKHRYIFVMTPERLLYLLIGYGQIPIHYLFVDEAQKISESEGRSAFYYQILGMVFNREVKPRVIFASPHIPNPGVYLGMIPDSVEGSREQLTSTFTPVSQEKFLIDFNNRILCYYNGLSRELETVGTVDEAETLQTFISRIGQNKKNLIYCNSKSRVIDMARKYANSLPRMYDPELYTLAQEIREQVHDAYYLADTVEKGVAYHVGFLPVSLRLRIEESFHKKEGGIHTIFCTSTLLEGVNLPADNLFITDYKNGKHVMSAVEFRNLIGRVGRIQYTLYGNVFLVCMPGAKTTPDNYYSLLVKDIEPQELSIANIQYEEKEHIVSCLLEGKTKIEKMEGQTQDSYDLMRKVANILLCDIMKGRKSRLRSEFDEVLSRSVIEKIKMEFTGRVNQPDDDITISLDQLNRLTDAIDRGLDYPPANFGNPNFNATFDFLERLCYIFDWETYESQTLGRVKNGKHSSMRYYATLLTQWISGRGIKYIINESIRYKLENGTTIHTDEGTVPFANVPEHKNKVIEDTLNQVNDILLFRLSNYFRRVSDELKKKKNQEFLRNDWYEYVEYGTTNGICIFLQKNGFSAEAANYIIQHEREYIIHTDAGVRASIRLLGCERESVKREAISIYYNIPELFVE